MSETEEEDLPQLHHCDKCNKSFQLQVQMNTHSCGKKKVYSCDLCGNHVFESMEALKEHLKIHACMLFSDDPNAPGKTNATAENQCDICRKTFKLKTGLKRHRLLHTAEKTFNCETCGKLFATSNSLSKHAKIHTRETQMFNCEECGRNFVKKHFYMAHLLTHKNPKSAKTHDCIDCGKSFAQKISLTKHIKTHTK